MRRLTAIIATVALAATMLIPSATVANWELPDECNPPNPTWETRSIGWVEWHMKDGGQGATHYTCIWERGYRLYQDTVKDKNVASAWNVVLRDYRGVFDEPKFPEDWWWPVELGVDGTGAANNIESFTIVIASPWYLQNIWGRTGNDIPPNQSYCSVRVIAADGWDLNKVNWGGRIDVSVNNYQGEVEHQHEISEGKDNELKSFKIQALCGDGPPAP